MSTRTELLEELHNFVSETGMPAGRLGRLAINDPGLVARLERGGDVTTTNLDRLRAFMAQHRRAASRESAGEVAA